MDDLTKRLSDRIDMLMARPDFDSSRIYYTLPEFDRYMKIGLEIDFPEGGKVVGVEGDTPKSVICLYLPLPLKKEEGHDITPYSGDGYREVLRSFEDGTVGTTFEEGRRVSCGDDNFNVELDW